MNEQPNPYAAPSRGSDQARGPGSFRLSGDLRRQIAGVAKLMFVAGGLQIAAAVIGLVRGGISIETVLVAAIAGFVPLFVMLGGMTLHGVGSSDEGNDLPGLLTGFRQLQVAFVVKGVTLILIIVFAVVSMLAMMFGLGRLI